MKKIALVIILIVFGRNLFGQDTLQFRPIALNKLVAFEKSLGSEPKGIQFFNPYYDEDFEDLTDEHPNVKNRTMIFKRNYDTFYPALHSWYFFDTDSVVRLVYYNWGFANTTVESSDDELLAQQYRKGDFAQKYVDEKAVLIRKLGKPKLEDKKEGNGAFLTVKTVWEMPDKRVVLKMNGDRKIQEVTAPGLNKTIIEGNSYVVIKILLKIRLNQAASPSGEQYP